jgi:hypothetical protein
MLMHWADELAVNLAPDALHSMAPAVLDDIWAIITSAFALYEI